MANCETCKIKTSAPENAPYNVYEFALTRMDRMAKRLWVTVLVLIFLLVGSNGAWLWYESQWETVESWEITQENEDGINNYIGNDGDIFNGETDNQKD